MRRPEKLALLFLLPLALFVYFLWPRKGTPLPREYQIIAIPLPERANANYANAINEKGEIVGGYIDEGSPPMHAFCWVPNAGSVKLFDGDAEEINASGQIVGKLWGDPSLVDCVAQTANGDHRLIRIATSETSFTGNNNLGQTVGTVVIGKDEWGLQKSAACVWDASGNATPLSSKGGTYSKAADINDLGQVVGNDFFWDPLTNFYQIGNLGGHDTEATSMNNKGQVVGYSSLPDGKSHAFIWAASGGIQDLDTPDSIRSEATSINDGGQVVGWFDPAGPIRDSIYSWSVAQSMSTSGLLTYFFPHSERALRHMASCLSLGGRSHV